MKRRITAICLVVCVLFQMTGSYLAFPAFAWAVSERLPRKVVRVTEEEIREALENDDGSFYLDEEYIPFDTVHSPDARALVLEKLKDSILVRQEKLGGKCTAVVAVTLPEEDAGAVQEEETADTENEEAEEELISTEALVENVFMIGMNGGSRACEFVLEIETDGGIVVEKLYVDEFIGIAGGPDMETATSSDGSEEENTASPSEAENASSSDAAADNGYRENVIEADPATPSGAVMRTAQAKLASPSEAGVRETDEEKDAGNSNECDDETDDEEEEYDDADLIDDVNVLYATPSDLQEEDAEEETSPYGMFKETGTDVLKGVELEGLVKKSGEPAGLFGMLAQIFSLNEQDDTGITEQEESEAPVFRVAANGIVVLKTSRDSEGLPANILQELADKFRIYPGTGTTNSDGSVVWTAYDAGNEESASTKVTVTFPQGITIPEDYYLYLRKVDETDPYYPKEEAVKTALGDYNDLQCWAIHWVKVWNEENEWKYDVAAKFVLSETDFAEVQIEYLEDTAYLQGPKGQRKLHVYNSRQKDGAFIEDVGELTDVTATDEAYTGFTYKTNHGGPYVFVNNKIYEGFVNSVAITQMTDGSAPFDDDDKPGNDSGDSNKIIRSYDVIQYNLTVNFGARQNGAVAKEADMGFEMTMDADITAAVFDTSQMLWLGKDYAIEYLDKDGDVVLRQGSDGKLTDRNGNTKSLNDIVLPGTAEEKSYTTDIVSQRLRGTISLKEETNVLAANQTLSAAVHVLGAHQGSMIRPVFRAWLVGNEENYGSESKGEGNDVQLAQKVTANEIKADPVTVSAAARFNLELAKNANVSYKGWFDSSAGKEVNSANKDSYTAAGQTVTGGQLYELLEALAVLEENTGRSNPEEFTDSENQCFSYLNGLTLSDYAEVFKKIRYGRITGYGITLQIYNQAADGQNTASKGFKGVSLPQGAVEFDLNLEFSPNVITGNLDETQYYAQLWEYNENVASAIGKQNKNMYWAGLDSTKYAAWAAPYNSGNPADIYRCYNGGSWYHNAGSGDYHFTVRDYDLNFLPSGLKFPTHKAGNSGASSGYNTYIGCFSAGYVQILNVFPRYQSADLNMETGVTVKNLTASTVDGQSISADGNDATGYAHETNTKDNGLRDNIPLYAKGTMTKANAFCTAKLFDDKSINFTGTNYFLGTYFWGTSYDCSAFAGQEVTLVGAARINAGDYQIRHMNILQLFDSEALSVNKNKIPYVDSMVNDVVKGSTTILYAADPDYKDGYNTQDKTVMEYMSTVREEDLIYYDSLKELEDDGYQCVGIMAELRNWAINGEGGYSTAMVIPMNVSEEERFVGKTVGTVNAVRIWTNEEDMGKGSVSWKDGVYDPSTGKNSVAGYTSVNTSSDEHYCGQVANAAPYEKTEYENGQVILGTNTGGYLYGSSLLILSYKSKVDINVDNGGVDNSGEAALYTFDMDKGNYTVNYRLNSIVAERDETNGKPQEIKTGLTVLAKLDAGWEGQEQRISVAADSYSMKPSSEKMLLTDEYGNALDEQSVKISADPGAPTTVHYAFIDETTGAIDDSKIYTIQVYAERDTNGTQVTFKLTDVTVGVSVPDITYDALIDPKAAKNNDRIQANAYISGTSDVRAYSETAGNMDSVTIGIIQLAGTRLVKDVDQRYIELDGKINYTVTYTNSGKEPIDVYLYDLKPNPEDSRGSNYAGDIIIDEIAAELSGGSTASAAEINFYYSTLGYDELYELVSTFGADGDTGNRDKDKVNEMLQNEVYFQPFGKISFAGDHQFQLDETLESMDPVNRETVKNQITGIYAVVTNLDGSSTLSIKLTGQTKDNKAGNLYRNIANSWLGDTSEPLTSNVVETSVLSRTISGVVWYDSNLNGERESDEETLSGVTCSLFKWNKDTEEYESVPWNGGPNGRAVEVTSGSKDQQSENAVLTTGADGSYGFSNLAPGEYIVAFSGETLEKYTGATTYQVNGGNDGTTNDAVALINTESNEDKTVSINGIDSETYSYAIAYSLSDETDVEAVPLHTIDEILGESIRLTNDVELHANMDCGLVITQDLMPNTGGRGTYPYRTGGMLLIAVCFLSGIEKRRKRRKEDI